MRQIRYSAPGLGTDMTEVREAGGYGGLGEGDDGERRES